MILTKCREQQWCSWQFFYEPLLQSNAITKYPYSCNCLNPSLAQIDTIFVFLCMYTNIQWEQYCYRLISDGIPCKYGKTAGSFENRFNSILAMIGKSRCCANLKHAVELQTQQNTFKFIHAFPISFMISKFEAQHWEFSIESVHRALLRYYKASIVSVHRAAVESMLFLDVSTAVWYKMTNKLDNLQTCWKNTRLLLHWC